MTLESLIKLLGTSGINSKKQVIDLLKSNDIKEFEELKVSIESKIKEIDKNE